jgi:hypothetical protein
VKHFEKDVKHFLNLEKYRVSKLSLQPM